MACRGVHFAITEEQFNRLLAAKSDNGAVKIALEDIEEKWDKEWLQESDKSWDAIHRCLTDGTLRCKGSSVLEKCILGGQQLHKESDRIISLLTPSEAKEVASALQKIGKEWFQQKYFGLQRKILWVKYSDYDGPIGEEDFEYSWSYFEDIRAFFEKSAKQDRAVLFSVDQ